MSFQGDNKGPSVDDNPEEAGTKRPVDDEDVVVNTDQNANSPQTPIAAGDAHHDADDMKVNSSGRIQIIPASDKNNDLAPRDSFLEASSEGTSSKRNRKITFPNENTQALEEAMYKQINDKKSRNSKENSRGNSGRNSRSNEDVTIEFKPSMGEIVGGISFKVTDPQHESLLDSGPDPGWDYMIVFEPRPQKNKNLHDNLVRIMTRLLKAGFVLSQTIPPPGDKFLLRLKMIDTIMKIKAQDMQYRLILKDEFGGGYLEYATDRDDCFVNDDAVQRGEPYFTCAQRIEIILQVIESKDVWGCGLNLKDECVDKNILDAFAIHNVQERDQLVKGCVKKDLWNPLFEMPYLKLRDYIGIQVSLYFGWCTHFGRMLWILGFFGIPTYIVYQINVSAKATAGMRFFYAIISLLWSTLSNELWYRKNSSLNLLWGSDKSVYYGANVRSEYIGQEEYGFYSAGGWVRLDDLAQGSKTPPQHDTIVAEADESETDCYLPINRHGSFHKARRNLIISYFITFFMTCAVIGVTFCLLFFRSELIDSLGGSGVALFVPGIINAIFILVVDNLWKILSVKLTDYENHRSDRSYEDSLIIKRFAFQFFSNYTSLLYIAFVRPWAGRRNQECVPAWGGRLGTTPCFGELEIQLLTLLATRITISQGLEILLPFILQYLGYFFKVCGKKEVDGDKLKLSRYYKEASLPHYHDTMTDYSEIVLLIGYVSLFGLAFPIAALFVAINNVIEIRVDALKILKLHKRVDATFAQDIGAWKVIMMVISYVSVLTNLGMLIFTSDSFAYLFPGITQSNKWLSFFLVENIIIMTKFWLNVLIPDVKPQVLKQLARRNYDIARFFKIHEEPEFVPKPKLVIKENDKTIVNGLLGAFDYISDLSDDDMAEFTDQQTALLRDTLGLPEKKFERQPSKASKIDDCRQDSDIDSEDMDGNDS